MFNSITEDQYEEILKLSKIIYAKDVEVKAGSPNDLERERANVEKAYNEYNSFFDKNLFNEKQIDKDGNEVEYNPAEAKKIFKLNLLFHNNDLFYRELKKNCFIQFMNDDIDKLKEYYYSEQLGLKNKWDRIVTNLSKGYYINEQIIREKLEEIMEYSNFYEPKQFKKIS